MEARRQWNNDTERKIKNILGFYVENKHLYKNEGKIKTFHRHNTIRIY
jgi:hypothetical protein